MLLKTQNTLKYPLLFWMILLLLSLNMNGQENPKSALDTYKSEPVRWMKYSDHSGALYNQIAVYAEDLLNQRQKNVSELVALLKKNK